jgi:hypothetical protein
MGQARMSTGYVLHYTSRENFMAIFVGMVPQFYVRIETTLDRGKSI